MIAACGHQCAIDNAMPITMQDAGRCGCLCVQCATYCPECAARAVADGVTFADDDAAWAWLATVPDCRCWG